MAKSNPSKTNLDDKDQPNTQENPEMVEKSEHSEIFYSFRYDNEQEMDKTIFYEPILNDPEALEQIKNALAAIKSEETSGESIDNKPKSTNIVDNSPDLTQKLPHSNPLTNRELKNQLDKFTENAIEKAEQLIVKEKEKIIIKLNQFLLTHPPSAHLISKETSFEELYKSENFTPKNTGGLTLPFTELDFKNKKLDEVFKLYTEGNYGTKNNKFNHINQINIDDFKQLNNLNIALRQLKLATLNQKHCEDNRFLSRPEKEAFLGSIETQQNKGIIGVSDYVKYIASLKKKHTSNVIIVSLIFLPLVPIVRLLFSKLETPFRPYFLKIFGEELTKNLLEISLSPNCFKKIRQFSANNKDRLSLKLEIYNSFKEILEVGNKITKVRELSAIKPTELAPFSFFADKRDHTDLSSINADKRVIKKTTPSLNTKQKEEQDPNKTKKDSSKVLKKELQQEMEPKTSNNSSPKKSF